MASVEALPTLLDSRRSSPLDDEKATNEKGHRSSVEVARSLEDTDFDDLRIIDIDENGKEKPIGKLFYLGRQRPLTYYYCV